MDVILSDLPDSHSISGVLKVALSDHYLVYTTIKCASIEVTPKNHDSIRFRDYNQFDLDCFCRDLLACESVVNPDTATWTSFSRDFINVSKDLLLEFSIREVSEFMSGPEIYYLAVV